MHLDTPTLKRDYFKAQKKVWKYTRKMAKSSYTSSYDPHKIYKGYQRSRDEWRRWGVDVAAELRRRGVWLIDPAKHNKIDLD